MSFMRKGKSMFVDRSLVKRGRGEREESKEASGEGDVKRETLLSSRFMCHALNCSSLLWQGSASTANTVRVRRPHLSLQMVRRVSVECSWYANMRTCTVHRHDEQCCLEMGRGRKRTVRKRVSLYRERQGKSGSRKSSILESDFGVFKDRERVETHGDQQYVCEIEEKQSGQNHVAEKLKNIATNRRKWP